MGTGARAAVRSYAVVVASDDPVGLSWPKGGLRFDPATEEAFRAGLGADAWVRVRVVTAVAAIGTLGYLLLAPSEDPGRFEQVAPYLTLVVLFVQFAYSYLAPPAGSLQWAAPLTWLTVGTITATAVLRSAEGHGTVTFEVLVMFVLAVYFASGVGIGRAAVVAAVVSLVWLLLGLAHDVPRPSFPYDLLLLLATNAVGAFGAFVLEVERRRAFELQQRLESVAFTDPLTGLPDRRGFDQRLDDVWAIAVEEHRPMALAMLDVDAFKEVNDRGGHAAGDRGLVLVADRLRAILRRPLDAAGRIGGDEFAVVWFDTDERWLSGALDELCRHVAEASAAAGAPFSVSVGAVVVARPSGTPGPAIHAADQLLLRVKRSGKGRAQIERLAS